MTEKDFERIGRMLTEIVDSRLERIDQRLDRIEARLDRVEARLDRIEARLDQMDVRFDQVEARLDQMDARFEQIDARFEQIDARFEQVDARFEQVDARFEQVDARFTSFKEEIIGEVSHLLDLQAERLHKEFCLVAEQNALLFELKDGLESRLDAVEEKLGRRLDYLTATLSMHCSDPAAHKRRTKVKEEVLPYGSGQDPDWWDWNLEKVREILDTGGEELGVHYGDTPAERERLERDAQELYREMLRSRDRYLAYLDFVDRWAEKEEAEGWIVTEETESP